MNQRKGMSLKKEKRVESHWENLLLWGPIYMVKAKYRYKSDHPLDLNFDVDDVIDVLGIENDDWWNGSIAATGTFGSFPRCFVEEFQAEGEPFQDKINSILNKIGTPKNPLIPKLPPRNNLKQRISSSNSTNGSNEDITDDVKENNVEDCASIKKLSRYSRTLSGNPEAENEDKTRTNFRRNSKLQKIEKKNPLRKRSVVVDDDFQGPLELAEVDFDIVDEHARKAPKQEESSIQRLSRYLTSEWTHPIYQLRCIFTWVAHNIAYDVDAFYGGILKLLIQIMSKINPIPLLLLFLLGLIRNNSGKDILKSRKAVCAGYSELFHELAVSADLETWKITGNAKGAGYEPGDLVCGNSHPHAWNAVRVDSEYLLIDCTWGAGTVSNMKFNRGFNDFYFLVSPLRLIYTHFPENKQHQYITPTITNAEFNELPYLKSEWFSAGFNMVNYFPCVVEVDNDCFILEIEQTDLETDKFPSCSLEWKGQKIDTLVNRLGGVGPNGGRLYRIECGIPSGGGGKLSIYVFKSRDGGPFAAGFKVVNRGNGLNYTPLVKTYSTPFQFSLICPTQSTLKYKERTKFEIILFEQNVRQLPTLIVYSQGFKKKKTLDCDEIDRDGSVTFSGEMNLNELGEWILSYTLPDQNMFHHIAAYQCQ
ncbi:hypothetical protein G9A89_015217 [Geosiphon pyriformis]|nr:hypothetical protein G9A89_015217 [Geosiphon pyriformis]